MIQNSLFWKNKYYVKSKDSELHVIQRSISLYFLCFFHYNMET